MNNTIVYKITQEPYGDGLPNYVYVNEKAKEDVANNNNPLFYGGNRSLEQNIATPDYYYDKGRAIFSAPNFITKSDVYHTLFKAPMGNIQPRYDKVSVVDKSLQSQYERDTILHRENIMASQMQVRNSQEWSYVYRD